MSNDILGKLDLNLDLLKTVDTVSVINSQFQEENERRWREALAASTQGQQVLHAIKETAQNTAEANVRLEQVIDHQHKHIALLEKQLSMQEQQLDMLKSIFASNEDGVIVEKEIMKLVQEQIDSNHPLWEYVKDKGGDILVAGGGPILWSAFKAYLLSKGIQL